MKQAKTSTISLSVFGILLINFFQGLSAHGLPGGNQCSSATGKLKAVSMLFRHGDRTPSFTYPLDPYKDYPWPGGEGALSSRGANQLFQSGLGKSIRYSSLLSLKCPENDVCTLDVDRIFVASSSVQRCVDSVSNFLDGILRVDWPSNLVGVIPMDEDEMLGYPGKFCPRYPFTYATPLNHPLFSKVVDFESSAGQELLEYLRNSSGLLFLDSADILHLADTLQVQHDNGFVLPEWTNSVWQQYLRPLSDIVFEILGELDIWIIRSGIFLNDMIGRFWSIGQGSSDRNILLYSAHDGNMASILHTMGILNQTVLRPAYGSSLNFELYENRKLRNDFEIRVVYFRNHADANPIKINIPSCQAPCAFKKFVQKFRSKMINNFDAVCEI